MSLFRRTLPGVAALAGLLLIGGLVWADDDEHGWHGFSKRRSGVAPVKNAQYAEECGACHFAYPPGLLPARSWKRIISGLGQHFGDNAELDAQTTAKLEAYLTANAADRSGNRRSQKLMRTLRKGDAPLRVSDVPYIRYKHAEIGPRYIEDNPKVRSLSNCNACHVLADQGDFDDDAVRIPGFTWWDDD